MQLPGVGTFRTVRTEGGQWLGVLELSSGERQFFLDDPTDPDKRQLVMTLSADDSRTLGEMLLGSQA